MNKLRSARLVSSALLTAGVVAALLPATPAASADTSGDLTGRILFTKTYPMDRQAYYSADANGNHQRLLVRPGAYCCLVRVSPNHERVLVMSADPKDWTWPFTGGTIGIGGTGYQQLKLTDPTLDLIPQAWSPDGRRIAFEAWDDTNPERTGIYTASYPDRGDLVRVTTRPGAPHDIPLDYSPDGKRLVFYRAVRADPDPTDIGGSLWVVNTDGSDPHQITTDAVPPNWWARWSPDGSHILFASERLQPSGAVWTVDPDGGHLTRVFADPCGGFPIQPIWSPDGQWIMFALDPTNDQFTHPANRLVAIRPDGSGLRLVSASHDFKSQPDWYE
jgi:Tol biopolymer transport system component